MVAVLSQPSGVSVTILPSSLNMAGVGCCTVFSCCAMLFTSCFCLIDLHTLTPEDKLRPVMVELAYNLESFNPVFTAVLLKVSPNYVSTCRSPSIHIFTLWMPSSYCGQLLHMSCGASRFKDAHAAFDSKNKVRCTSLLLWSQPASTESANIHLYALHIDE